jgi:hypothetical protein
MVSKQQKEHGMDISLFLESPSPRMWTALCPRSISKEALPFSPMTFLFAMDEIEANDAKARSSISHFSQKMYNIDTDF